MAKLKPGDRAPAFSLKDQDGNTVELSQFKGKKVFIYFYPKADTPGCTNQSCSVSAAMPDLKNLNVSSIGISPDSPKRQKSFDEKYSLNFPLLADEDRRTAQAWGAFGAKTMDGKKTEGIIRSSFLIDEDGSIIEAWYNVKPDDTVPKALEALKRKL